MRGGFRIGGGRRPLNAGSAALYGSRGHVASRPVVMIEPPDVVEMPGGLSTEQEIIWAELAPHALAMRTLVQATAAAFADLCEAIVLKRALLARIDADGFTCEKISLSAASVEHRELKAHPLLGSHRGMMQRVEAGFTRFCLTPIGKPIVSTVARDDPFAEFDDTERVQ